MRKWFLLSILTLVSAATVLTSAALVRGSTDRTAHLSAFDRPAKQRDAISPALAKTIGALGVTAGDSREVFRRTFRTGGTRRISLSRDLTADKACFEAQDETGSIASSCNPASAFFGRNAAHVLIRHDGSPSQPKNIQVVGIARPTVKAVEVQVGGAGTTVEPNADGAFWVEVGTPTQAHVGAGGTVISRAVDGTVLDRIVVPAG